MKKTCPECRERFDINLNELEEGDLINCPECNLEFTVVVDSAGNAKLRLSKEVGIDEESEEMDSYFGDETEEI